MINESAFHDASLETITLDWPNGTVELQLKTAKGLCFIRGFGVTRLLCPRVQEWGPSISINQIRTPRNVGDQFLLEIEMQSGDVVQVQASGFETEC